MKPIYLSVAGLQSYREKQEIDFTRLCDAGVFGIFGPTGSGKSSILDALTLALYGKVERAQNGTQGIMNHAESAISVAFEFSLTHAGGEERYRVERQFKRGGDISVNGTLCRLIRYENGEAVVEADKQGDVNSRIQEILGLSMADFTRAVVLPQGKFAEFLSLTGKDRRQMLQRLFHLEDYGDRLNSRLSQKVKDTDIALKEIAAEQQGLGDASEAAVAAAGLRLKESDARAAELRALLKEEERQSQERKQVREAQQEEGLLLQSMDRHAGQEPLIQERESRMDLSERAERVRPFLDALESAQRQHEQCRMQSASLEERLQETAARHEAVAGAYNRAKEELAAQDAPLQVKLEQLSQAMELERELGQLEEAFQMLERQLGETARELAASTEALGKEQELLRKAVARQAELKEHLKQVEVRHSERDMLHAAERDRNRMEAAEKQLAELEGEIRTARQDRERRAEDEVRLAAEESRLASSLVDAAEQSALHMMKLEAVDASFAALTVSLQEAIDDRKRQDRETERLRLAAVLAEELEPGEPCPVCGSLEHPAAPVRVSNPADSAPAAGLDVPERLLAGAQEARFAVRRLKLAADGRLQRLQEAMAARPSTGGLEAAAAHAPALAAAPGAPVSDPEGSETDALAAAQPSLPPQANDSSFSTLVEKLESRLEALEGSGAMLDRTLAPLLAGLSRLEREQAEWKAAQQAQETAFAALLGKEQTAKASLQTLLSAWQDEYRELTPSVLEAELARLAEKDRASEDYRQRLAASEPFIESKQTNIQQMQSEIARLEKDKVQQETRKTNLGDRMAEAGRKIRERMNDTPEEQSGWSAQRRMDSLQSLLDRLRAEEKVQRVRLESVQQELQEISHRCTAARQALESAGAALHTGDAQYREALAKTDFNGADQIREALLDEETVRQWKEERNLYRETETRLKGKLEQVRLALNGRSLTEAEWLEGENRLADVRSRTEQAVDMKAKAERDFEDLQSKHEHWKALEARRKELQSLLNDLVKLQTVLRGNAFVEFVAEEQLLQVSRTASTRLGQLTRRRYAVEVDSTGGFVIRDDANGGIKRPVSSLSGGETFLASLALALALSTQIQLGGRYPLEFFFLDEGFGTLDPDLLETVVSALEKLHMDKLTVGVISHVPELKARLPRRLVVDPAEPTGRGSRIRLESL